MSRFSHLPAHEASPKPASSIALIDNKQAARLLSMSVRKLDDLRDRGLIPFVVIDRRIRFSVAALERWIEERTVNKIARRTDADYASGADGEGGNA